jgi:hypothetical protein
VGVADGGVIGAGSGWWWAEADCWGKESGRDKRGSKGKWGGKMKMKMKMKGRVKLNLNRVVF